MSKVKTQPTAISFQNNTNEPNKNQEKNDNEPLSGSKKVKNHQHSRQNHGEGF